ncbi:MAG: hypothetical protein ACI91G_001415 [Gammaproteobacteria bacterium]|jgi:hypothetical protein
MGDEVATTSEKECSPKNYEPRRSVKNVTPFFFVELKTSCPPERPYGGQRTLADINITENDIKIYLPLSSCS